MDLPAIEEWIIYVKQLREYESLMEHKAFLLAGNGEGEFPKDFYRRAAERHERGVEVLDMILSEHRVLCEAKAIHERINKKKKRK